MRAGGIEAASATHPALAWAAGGVSIVLHGVLLFGWAGPSRSAPAASVVEMRVVQTTVAEPEPVRVEEPVAKEEMATVERPVAKVIPTRRVPNETGRTSPPIPNEATTVPPAVPEAIAGLSADSFSSDAASSASTFGAGNTAFATPPNRRLPPAEIPNLPPATPVSLADISSEPVLLSTPSVKEVLGVDYPPLAKERQVEGVVRIKVLVDHQGQVTQVKAVKGPPELRPAAEQLARNFKYKPAVAAGQPVSVWWFEEIPFKIYK